MNNTPRQPDFVMLAPMEGVVDVTLRAMLTAIGGIDRCVTEFVRVTQQVLPARVFRRFCPELDQNCRTACGTPVYLQLLGDDPTLMSANAEKAVQLGATAIDLNFGCPARTVNNHGGGSVLLKTPERLYAIAAGIRHTLPADVALTGKMRLGYADKSLALDNALALEAAGVAEIAVHGRTKTEGYRPPAWWDEIGRLSDALSIPVIANGEIWTSEDLQRCMDESHTTRIMLGRGLIACPDLALLVRDDSHRAMHWGEAVLLLLDYFRRLEKSGCDSRHINNLLKQWLIYLRMHFAEGFLFFESVKRLREPAAMHQALCNELDKQQKRRPVRSRIGGLDLRVTLENAKRTPLLTATPAGF